MISCARNIAIILIFTSSANFNLLSQSFVSNDSINAIRLYEKASEQYLLNNYEDAIITAEKSLQMTIGSESYELQGDILLLTSKCFSESQMYENAIIYLIRASGAYDKIQSPKLISSYVSVAEIFTGMELHEKAEEYYEKAIDQHLIIMEEHSDPLLMDKSAEASKLAGNYTQAEIKYRELAEWAKQNDQNELYVKSLFNISEIFLTQKMYPDNLLVNQRLYDYYEKKSDTAGMALVSNNQGFTYLISGLYKSALTYFLKSLDIGMNIFHDPYKKSYLLANTGICYQNLNDFDNSLKYIRLALEISKSLRDHLETARLENITALIYLSRNDLYNAGIFSMGSIESARKAGDQRMLQECCYTYSKILKQGNDHIKALAYYELYLNIRDSLLVEQRLAEQQLSQKMLELEKTEKELRLILADEDLKELEMKNLLIEAEKRSKEIELLRRERELEQSEKQRILQSILLTREKHESELRQKEIESLEQDREIRELLLKQKEAEEKERIKEIRLLEIEKERQELEIEREKEARRLANMMLMLLGIIIIIVVTGFFVVRNKNQILGRQKIEIEEKNFILEQKNEEILTQNEQIIKQKDLIEEKNKNITDSIHYARRIQSAVLPPEDFLDGIFQDYFLFFRPKDIVSGDFYWSANKGDMFYVAAADCTGHGVPGAFMSMLGITFLNEIVNHPEAISSSEMLNRLRDEVIIALKQKGVEGETKDGMDIALCVYDKKNMKLQFSGANNPMYLLRNDELLIYKADRMPIGISHDQAVFSRHEVNLQRGDMIYIFSDGFADQFGGALGKKFKYNRFRESLKEIGQMTMSAQKEKLSNLFDDWKSNFEQIDDVLVIGFRI